MAPDSYNPPPTTLNIPPELSFSWAFDRFKGIFYDQRAESLEAHSMQQGSHALSQPDHRMLPHYSQQDYSSFQRNSPLNAQQSLHHDQSAEPVATHRSSRNSSAVQQETLVYQERYIQQVPTEHLPHATSQWQYACQPQNIAASDSPSYRHPAPSIYNTNHWKHTITNASQAQHAPQQNMVYPDSYLYDASALKIQTQDNYHPCNMQQPHTEYYQYDQQQHQGHLLQGVSQNNSLTTTQPGYQKLQQPIAFTVSRCSPMLVSQTDPRYQEPNPQRLNKGSDGLWEHPNNLPALRQNTYKVQSSVLRPAATEVLQALQEQSQYQNHEGSPKPKERNLIIPNRSPIPHPPGFKRKIIQKIDALEACGNCGRMFHEVKSCVGPVDKYGMIDACPECNTSLHTVRSLIKSFPEDSQLIPKQWEQCTHLKEDVKSRLYLLQTRHKRPLLRYVLDIRDTSVYNNITGLKPEPWTREFALRLASEDPNYWKRHNYKNSIEQQTAQLPADPAWVLGKIQVGSLADPRGTSIVRYPSQPL
ncbi:hypothetical protein B7494_g3360 [Chlorociboria aeruginascens]|nr:hypothetical protein B7494_g3360 [Chlorociboria aeruginascens]